MSAPPVGRNAGAQTSRPAAPASEPASAASRSSTTLPWREEGSDVDDQQQRHQCDDYDDDRSGDVKGVQEEPGHKQDNGQRKELDEAPTTLALARFEISADAAAPIPPSHAKSPATSSTAKMIVSVMNRA